MRRRVAIVRSLRIWDFELVSVMASPSRAGSTLIVFALFAPIRRRVQRLVDRRFNRSRYDAELIVAAFARRLSDEVDLEALRSEILATVSAVVEPSSVSLWLRE
jgi:hypothetical protein